MTLEESDELTRGERKYEALGSLLRRASPDEDIVLSFELLEALVGFALPAAARTKWEWWSSNPYQPQSRAWLRTDRRAVVDFESQTVKFTFEVYVRNNSLQTIRGIRSRELAVARDALQHGADETHIGLGWWEPHTVYVLHFKSIGQFKVGVARVGSRRIRDLKGRLGELVDLEWVANLWAAKVIEQHALEMVEEAWLRPDRFSAGKGGETERWGDWLELPLLSTLLADLELDRDAPSWHLSVMRSGGAVRSE